MQTVIDTKSIIAIVTDVGNDFLSGFRKTSIPENMEDFMAALKSIETKCFEQLKARIDLLHPGIPWVEDNEFDGVTQQQPAADPRYWLCDTMDGAIQYLQHIPGWTINLVLIEQGEPSFSMIYDPLTNELFSAEKNKGAFLNGASIRPGNKVSTENMLAVLEYGHQLQTTPDWKKQISSSFIHLLECFGAVRNYGPHGLQLAYIAAGRIDLFVQNDLDTHNWLAGLLISKEAGAEILTTGGATWKWGNGSLLVGTKKAVMNYLDKKI